MSSVVVPAAKAPAGPVIDSDPDGAPVIAGVPAALGIDATGVCLHGVPFRPERVEPALSRGGDATGRRHPDPRRPGRLEVEAPP